MPTHQVNLDSLIRREPFDSDQDESVADYSPRFKAGELHHTHTFFRLLRKPDFQRETSNWTPTLITEFVRTFLDGGLIPSIIIWQSQNTNRVFIVDGAHRVSALIAWVNDDYGDGEISRKAWAYDVPAAQAALHRKTKALIDNQIGSYAQLNDIGANPENTEDLLKRRRGAAIALKQLEMQTVKGDSSNAEKSFFRINSSAVAIDDTELAMIKGRKKPNAIATRALISAGKGFKYWKDFPNASQIEEAAAKGYKLLFGEIIDIGPQSPDIPRAGQPYSSEAFKMVLDIVNIFNSVTPAMWTYKETGKKPPTVPQLADDPDGTTTLQFLEKVVSVAQLAAGAPDHSGCLGLEQAVYAYGSTGKVSPAAYIASLKFAVELEQNNKRLDFSAIRKDFEEFLVRHKIFINALTHSKGSRTRPLESIVRMYNIVFDALSKGLASDEGIIAALIQEPSLKDLKVPIVEEVEPAKKRFSKTVVKTKVVNDILLSRPKCTVCGARLPPSSRSKDHKIKQDDGGLGELENLDFTHPYCNASKDAIEKRFALIGGKP